MMRWVVMKLIIVVFLSVVKHLIGVVGIAFDRSGVNSLMMALPDTRFYSQAYESGICVSVSAIVLYLYVLPIAIVVNSGHGLNLKSYLVLPSCFFTPEKTAPSAVFHTHASHSSDKDIFKHDKCC
jgi:hypothetical protein